MYLIEHLTKNTYSNIHQIFACVKEVFGLNNKQPKGIPHKLDEKKQLACIDAYEALKTSYSKDESIVFVDAVHPTVSTNISHGWIRTVQNKVMAMTDNRSLLNIIGALNLSDIEATIVSDCKRINSENFVRFLCKLRESYLLTHKLHLRWDEISSQQFSQRFGVCPYY